MIRSLQTAEALIAHDADVNALNGNSFTPIAYAARNSRTEVAHLLLRSGATIMQQGGSMYPFETSQLKCVQHNVKQRFSWLKIEN